MLPPSADMVRIRIVEKPDSWPRVCASVASTRPSAAAAAAVTTVMMTKPGRCEKSGSWNTSRAHRNITQICTKPMSVRNSHLPARRPRHADARRQQPLERARLDLVEQRPAGAADHREQQEHHADAGGVERDERPASAVACASRRRSRRRCPSAPPCPMLTRRHAAVASAAAAAARHRRRRAAAASAAPACSLELLQAALHHQVRRGGHRDLLQQSVDHLRRDRIRDVREQLDRRSAAAEAARSRRPRRCPPGSRPRPARSPFLTSASAAARSASAPPCLRRPRSVCTCRLPSFASPAATRWLNSEWSSSTTAMLIFARAAGAGRRTPWRRSRRRRSAARTSSPARRGRAAGWSGRRGSTSTSLAQLPSGQVDEHRLKARAAHVDVLDCAAGLRARDRAAAAARRRRQSSAPAPAVRHRRRASGAARAGRATPWPAARRVAASPCGGGRPCGPRARRACPAAITLP